MCHFSLKNSCYVGGGGGGGAGGGGGGPLTSQTPRSFDSSKSFKEYLTLAAND